MASEKIDRLKDEGNKHFVAKEWLKAAGKYTQAIKADPNNAVLYSNRSAALLKLLKVTKAVEDADMCIKLKPEWEKGYFRKGAILEEQNKLNEAMEVYQVAAKLVPESKELSHKIHTLRNQMNKQAKSAKLSAAVDPSSGKETNKDTSNSKDTSKGSKDAGTKSAASSSKQQVSSAAAPAGAKPQKAPSERPTQPNGSADVVYDDLGTVEAAKFAEEYLGLLRDQIEEGAVIPTVHFLPGRKLESSEEQEAHVRIAGAFETPDTLASLTEFLRAKGGQLQAQAVLTVVPKSAIAFPRVWDKPKWPGGERPGIFAQLETPTVQKLWFVPTQGKKAETPLAADFDRFSVLPRLIKS